MSANMNWTQTLADLLTLLVGFLHFGFMHLEMNLWTSPRALKAFRMQKDFADSTKVLAANQGIYNGMLAAGLLYSCFLKHSEFLFQKFGAGFSHFAGMQLQGFLLFLIVVVGIYGALTVSKRILYLQTAPALLALILLVI